MKVPYSRFESEMQVRPDDIDMNQHVHNSRYFDYVLAARYDQMERCYKYPMEEFLAENLGWVVSRAVIDYKRALGLGERFKVITGITEFLPKGCIVTFQILSQKTQKLCCEGEFHYTMVNTQTGRSELIPERIAERFRV